MESLSKYLAAPPPLLIPSRTLKSSQKSQFSTSNYIPICTSTNISSNRTKPTKPQSKHTIFPTIFLKDFPFLESQFSFLFLGLSSPLSSLASENTFPTEEFSSKINLESILVSIDNFFNRYPFFVASIAFVWLIVIPLTEEYLQKYKFISAINAFKKLQDDPNSQLLDIRDSKSLGYLGSPNLKILNKNAKQVEFREGGEDDFVKKVLEIFGEPAESTICIVDNFDGNSLTVAELLVKNGFKEAYAIRGGLRGKKGWQEIQESLLPPSVHVYPKKSKSSKQIDGNGGVKPTNKNTNGISSALTSSSVDNITNKEIGSKEDSSSIITSVVQSEVVQRPGSPYSNYLDLKPPSSPTPSKPN